MPTVELAEDYHGIESNVGDGVLDVPHTRYLSNCTDDYSPVGDGVLDVPHDIHQIIRMIIQLRKSMENDIIIYGGKYEKNI